MFQEHTNALKIKENEANKMKVKIINKDRNFYLNNFIKYSNE